MAKKTAEERRIEQMERLEQEKAEKYQRYKGVWIDRLMAAMEHANTVWITNGTFEVYITDKYKDHHKFTFNPKLSEDNVIKDLDKLEEFEYIVEVIKEMKQEQERIERIKSGALAKLTAEERKALGI